MTIASFEETLKTQIHPALKNITTYIKQTEPTPLSSLQTDLLQVIAHAKWWKEVTESAIKIRSSRASLKGLYNDLEHIKLLQQAIKRLEIYEDKLLANLSELKVAINSRLEQAISQHDANRKELPQQKTKEWYKALFEDKSKPRRKTIVYRSIAHLENKQTKLLKHTTTPTPEQLIKSHRILQQTLLLLKTINKHFIQSKDIKKQLLKYDTYTQQFKIWQEKHTIHQQLKAFLRAKPEMFEDLDYQILKSEVNIEVETLFDHLVEDAQSTRLPQLKEMILLMTFYGKGKDKRFVIRK